MRCVAAPARRALEFLCAGCVPDVGSAPGCASLAGAPDGALNRVGKSVRAVCREARAVLLCAVVCMNAGAGDRISPLSGLHWFRRGLESRRCMSRFSHLVKQLKQSNCKRRTFRTRRLIAASLATACRWAGQGRLEAVPAARESSPAGLLPGTLGAGEKQGRWPCHQRASARLAG